MEVTKTTKEKRIHHKLMVDGIPYFRNEYFEFDFKDSKWKTVKLSWSIGGKEGNGVYVEPKGILDNIGNYTSSELEKMFKEKTNKPPLQG